MKNLALGLVGVLAVIAGAALLLLVLPGAAVQPPWRRGLNYWSAVLGRMLGPGTVRVTLLGVGLLAAGVALNLRAALPTAADVALSRGGRFCLFWGLAAFITLALLGLLLCITFGTLGLE